MRSKEVQKDYDGYPAPDVFIEVTQVYKGNPRLEVEVRVKGGEIMLKMVKKVIFNS